MLSFNHLDHSRSLDNYNCPEENVEKQSQNHTSHREQQMPPFSGFQKFDELCFDNAPSPFQLSEQECANLNSIHSEVLELFAPEELPSSGTPFRILNCRSNFEERKSEKVKVSDSAGIKVDDQSLNDIIRLAGEKFIQSRSLRVDDLPNCSQGLSDVSSQHLSDVPSEGLSDEKTEDVELIIQHLLSSAEKIGEQQFECARNHLNHCYKYSTNKGDPLQRLVYYFSAALRERIDLELGAVSSSKVMSLEYETAMRNPSSASLSLQQRIPFCHVMQFAGMQAITENVAQAKKIHLIDLDIKLGMHCSILIQDLASRQVCPVEHLKITAVGTKLKKVPAETGKQLLTFAESMNLSFSFHAVTVDDILDLNENLFELDPNEVIAVYSPYFLWTMIGQQDRLEYLMRLIRSINPAVMVVCELEVNHNSPMFLNRFVEALFFYGAYFDCFGDSMPPDDDIRFAIESLFGYGIQNIVSAEGKERTVRQVKNNVWVSFFNSCNMVQKELSSSSLFQAGLVAKNFQCDTTCSLNMDGKSLILGWKGTSLLSLSAWGFL